MRGTSIGDLEAVAAIAQRGSFRSAADELRVSSTALSNAIAKLEADLGVRLFNRTTRSVSLTEAGRNLLNSTLPALQEIQAALDVARGQQSTPAGTLRINAFATAARFVLPTLILPFLERYPQVHIDLVTEGNLVDIVRDGFDIGVRVEGLVPVDMISVPVGPPMPFAVVASPIYLETHPRPRSPTDLTAHRCIRGRLPKGTILKWRFEKGGEHLEIDVDGPITLDEPGLVRTAVMHGTGLGFLFEPDVAADIASGRMVRVLEDWTPPGLNIAIYYPSRRNLTAALRAFVTAARQLSRD
ncbi:DNA-binding transcriptional regulator, LysR family [Methylobacterium sp. 174MFSha1.1]|uniref:LysR family transcriptional regulator n=1 Tax=Methylobacterium sp. 174MFSha1.1 TaxID=1502749 RepID=UPI0008E3FB5E|nr:LysR family transcriptional regulator [Methylobacterium sp. 174MFSha1.1]SFV09096.1 DNA-binding transcriptional regulator, LysR family [Methylobacterium sp. 174MFSha1.1]